jgi:hypothetical protein
VSGPPSGRDYRNRFPGFDVAAQARHWDQVTAGVVLDRLGPAPGIRFFTPDEEAVAIALCDQLTGQDASAADEGGPAGQRVPVAALIDARLAEQQTDGWRYADMPEDGQAWRDSLRHLDAEAREKFSAPFAECASGDQRALIQAVQDAGPGDWHGMNAKHLWSLWTRYACTAFYAHPHAWNEIGFSGPAYPRGYKSKAVGQREPFEVADALASDDPVRKAD